MNQLAHRLQLLSQRDHQHVLQHLIRGIEKESLRVTPQGRLAQTPHPEALGAAMTHPEITTDYSEALLEFITPALPSVTDVLQRLDLLHRYTYRHIGDELLWVNSMPCVLEDESGIPLARYGSSNVGRMKTLYREGLGHRYGRLMQTIAGIHYNFSVSEELWQLLHQDSNSALSLQDFKTEGYFGLIRNFRRYFWLLLYLFGAAPAVCRSFVAGRSHRLEPVGSDPHSLYTPYATSLRMGDLGYQSSVQEQLVVNYNDLGSYITTLRDALRNPHPGYTEIGVRGDDGEYRQLSDHLLQIENEFYSTVRPKRNSQAGETPLRTLWERGVEYVEVRCLDLNPYLPLGIDETQIRFLDTFLVLCLLRDSPATNCEEYHHINTNQALLVYEGRNPNLKLHTLEGERPLREWGAELFDQLAEVAELIDSAQGGRHHRDAVASFLPHLTNADLTPSARVIQDLKSNGDSYFGFALKSAEQHRDHFLRDELDPIEARKYAILARESLATQQAIEAADEISFDEYLTHYYRQYDFSLEP